MKYVIRNSVPLSPGQRYALDRGLDYAQSICIVQLYRAHRRIEEEALAECLHRLSRERQDLRHRFLRSEEGWHQIISGGEAALGIYFEIQKVSDCSEASWRTATIAAIDGMRSRLDLQDGPLSAVVLLDTGTEQKLAVLMSHMVSDLVSMTNFVDDIADNYLALVDGKQIREKRRSATFQEWCEYCNSRAHNERLQDSVAEYFHFEGAKIAHVPELGDVQLWPSNTASLTYGFVDQGFSRQDTEKFLQRSCGKYRVWPNVGLLSVLSATLSASLDGTHLPISIQESGRMIREAGLDLNGTIGFLTCCPMCLLPIVRGGTFLETVALVDSMYQRVQKYGVEVWMATVAPEVGSIARTMHEELRPRLWFNYLGHLGQQSKKTEELFVREATWPMLPDLESDGHETLAIFAGVQNGELWMRWEYCKQAFSRQFVEELAENFRVVFARFVTE